MWFIHCNLILQYVRIRIRRGAGRASGGKKGSLTPLSLVSEKTMGKERGTFHPH